jgi:NADPH2 dehydrogenase
LRNDEYGQDLTKFGVEIVQAVKSIMPRTMPLMMRISAIEYMEGGYDLDYMIEICKRYREAGVDLFHISSGGEAPVGKRKPGNYPGYQVPMARTIKHALHVPVIAVGQLSDPKLAEATLANGNADLVAVARGMLYDPYWAIHAIQAVSGQGNDQVPKQYRAAF